MNDEQPRSSSFAVTAVAFEGGLAIAAIAVGWLIGFSPLQKLPHTEIDWPDVLWQVGIGVLAAAPMFAGLWVIERLPLESLKRIGEIVERTLVPLFRNCSLADLAVISLMAGIGEEILFRGLIQDGLSQWIGSGYGPWIALAITSIVFGFAHAITRTYIVLAALAGAYLGLLFILTDSLIPPIVAHAVYDFGALAYVLNSRLRTDANDGSNE